MYSGSGGSFRLATNGPDRVYSVAEGGTGRTVGCPGGASCAVLVPQRKIVQAFGPHAYWLGGAGVERCAITGCPGGPDAVGDAPAGATSLRVDASGVYLLYPSMVGRIPTGGVFEVLAPLTGAIELGVNATRVFVQTAAGFVSCAKTGCGGAATDYLSTSSARFFVVDDANLHWIAADGTLSSCAANAATCSSPTAIVTIPTGPTIPPFGCLAQDAKNLYIGRYRGIDVFSK